MSCSGGEPEGPSRSRTRDTYRELFERSPDAILVIRGDRFVDANQAAVDMLGYASRDEVLETHPSELSPPSQPDGRDSYEKANEMIALAFANGSHRFEWDHRRADGQVFPVEVLLTAVEERGVRTLHVVWRDISERKRLEDQLRQTSKMEAIGRLAGGIAHDFNNLLVAILGHADLLAEDVADDPELVEHVGEISSAAERAAGLVRQLLAFSRRQELQPRTLDLGEVVHDLQSFLRRLLGEDVCLTTALPSEAVWMNADPGHLDQVIVNLCTNARDAMPTGGTLVIEVRVVTVSEGRQVASGELTAGTYAQLVVTDTGRGMSPSVLNRVFEPFFTTKEEGQGTGLGLATVYGIVKQAGGAVDIYSAVGSGTAVKVYFPAARGRAMAAPPPRQLPTRGGSETILFVEDEPAVAKLVLDVLRDKGYRILFANDGLQALRQWRAFHEEHPDEQIDLLFTDVVMPNMGGPELARELTEQGYAPRILYASGYTREALVELREQHDHLDLLEKPYSAAELVGRVREALDRPAPAPQQQSRGRDDT